LLASALSLTTGQTMKLANSAWFCGGDFQCRDNEKTANSSD
jgi:hypothetical protein